MPALSISTNASATQMANAIFGAGVTVHSASYSGQNTSSGIWSNGLATSPGVVPSDTGVILSTGRATDFTNANGANNQSPSTSTDTSGANNNALFNQVAGTNTFDASFLTTTFTPTGNVLTLRFVFASEEYPEYVNTIFNDVVLIAINGTPVPLVIGTATPTSINPDTNQNLFVSNTSGAFNTEMDGFTITLTAKIPVNAGVRNTLTLGIADVGDAQYDSNLLIAGDSAQSAFVALNDSVTVNQTGTVTANVLANDGTGTGMTITHINNIAVLPGQSVTLTTGQTVTLNANGTLSVTATNTTGPAVFTYQVQNGAGLTDTAFVTVNTVPCFVAGTRILTPDGPRRVEAIRPGDIVLTQDDGPQPVRWSGRRRVAAADAMAPIRIAAGTFGPHGRLLVSPQHRILIRSARAEMLFGEPEVLVAAKDLVNGSTVARVEGGEVEYVHLLFDRHQVIWAEGLATESFQPGAQVVDGLDEGPRAELFALFPELADPRLPAPLRAARRSLRAWEARVLLADPALALPVLRAA